MLAQQAGVTRHLVFPFEADIPFLQWMIVPYLSSGIFFCLVFFSVNSVDELRMLSQRLLLATVLASMVFVLYPLQFSWPRPEINSSFCSSLFTLLSLVDQPYNQLPSLHVCFCLIFWHALRASIASGLIRFVLAVWLTLTGAATVFVYQHHLMDVLSGIVLGLVCVRLIQPGRTEPNVAFYYLLAACMLLVFGVFGLHSLLCLYLAGSLALVSLAYYRQNRHFLYKKNGRYPIWIWLLYAPYLFGYKLTWHAVVWKEKRQPVIKRLTNSLWLGRRLSNNEVIELPVNCSVIDLANELTETPALRQAAYYYFPLLDLVTPPSDCIHEISAIIADEIASGKVVYLHCAMGYSRCIWLANSYMAASKKRT
ncbi:phosphatase PAP2 family protein [Undibacterium sp. TJN19]